MENLVYEDSPRYDLWLKLILGGVLAWPFVLGAVLLSENAGAALIMFGVTAFEALLLKAILPQRFQIFEDRFKIVLGGPFALNIPFSNIRDVLAAPGVKTLIYRGIRFATSTKTVVEIVRRKGLNLVISPANRGTFLEQLQQALEAAQIQSKQA